MGHTDTTSAQFKMFQERLYAYTSPSGAKLSDSKAKVHLHFPPVDLAYPYVLLKKGVTATDPSVGDLREEFELDAIVRGRARSDEPIVSAIGDLITQALIGFRDSSAAHGFTSIESIRRGEIDFADTPTPDEVIEQIVSIQGFSWPALLTDALTT